MPKGPQGQKRPADVIGNAVRVMRIATGEETDDVQDDGKDAARERALAARVERSAPPKIQTDTLPVFSIARHSGRGLLSPAPLFLETRAGW